MKDLNDLRKLAGLSQSLNEAHFDTQTDAEIESQFHDVPKEVLTLVYDALELLQGAGREGLSPRDWAARFKQLHPDAEEVGKLLSMTVKRLSKLRVERIAENLYRWIPEGTANMDGAYRQAAENHLDASHIIMATARKFGQVSISRLARDVQSQTRVTPGEAMMAVTMAIRNNPKMFTDLGGGYYQFNDPKERGSVDYSQMFRDIANKAGTTDLGDE